MCLKFKSIKTAEEDLTFYKEVIIQDGKFITPYMTMPIEIGKEYTLDTDIDELAKNSDGKIRDGVFHLYVEKPYCPFVLKTIVKKGEKYVEGVFGEVGVTRVRYEYLNDEDKERYEKLIKDFPEGTLDFHYNLINYDGKIIKINIGDKFNLINTEGKLIFEQWYDYIGTFCERTLVRLDKKYNYINARGELLGEWICIF